MRKKTALVVLVAALCYILGLVTAFYFPIPAHLGAALTRLLQGRVRPFMVSSNFNETIGYVTDRKAGPLADGNVTYLGDMYRASDEPDKRPSAAASSIWSAHRRQCDQEGGLDSLSGVSQCSSFRISPENL